MALARAVCGLTSRAVLGRQTVSAAAGAWHTTNTSSGACLRALSTSLSRLSVRQRYQERQNPFAAHTPQVTQADIDRKRKEILAHCEAEGYSKEQIEKIKQEMEVVAKQVLAMSRSSGSTAAPRRRRGKLQMSERPTIESIPTNEWRTVEPQPLKLPPNTLDSRVIEVKRTVNMTTGGKRPSRSALVVVGNGNGAIGFAVGKSSDVRKAISKAIQRAVRHMVFVERFDKHTIHHDVETKFCRTIVKLRRVPRGHGLRCHPTLMMICHLAGIQDIGAKVIGSRNPLNVVRASFKALGEQEPITAQAAARGKTLLRYDHPDQPPVVVARHGPAAQVQVQEDDVSAGVNKLEQEEQLFAWLNKFPLEQTLENFAAARQLRRQVDVTDAQTASEALAVLEKETKDTRAKELLTWVLSKPPNVDVSNTIMSNELDEVQVAQQLQ